jgi:hypothetical protein
LIRPPELSCNPSSSYIVANQKDLGEGNDELGLIKYLCSHFETIFYMPQNFTAALA